MTEVYDTARNTGGGGGWREIASREDALHNVWVWIDALDSCTWSGKAGSTQRCIAEALAVYALDRGGVRFAASVDEVSVEAGTSRPAARRALCALVERGLVERVTRGGYGRAPVWRLVKPMHEICTTSSFGGLGEDWTRWGAVGKTSALIWRRCIGGVKASDLAHDRGVHIQTIRKHLQKLRRHGLVDYHRDDGMWYACANPDVAALYHVDGSRERARRALFDRRGLEDTPSSATTVEKLEAPDISVAFVTATTGTCSTGTGCALS